MRLVVLLQQRLGDPATIGDLDRNEMEFGTQILIPRTTISSKIAPNTLGPGLPPRPLFGTTGGNNGVFPLPTFALVYRQVGFGQVALIANNPHLFAMPLS